MKRILDIILSTCLLPGCAKEAESYERAGISMSEDTTAYIQMLEKERNSCDMMLR